MGLIAEGSSAAVPAGNPLHASMRCSALLCLLLAAPCAMADALPLLTADVLAFDAQLQALPHDDASLQIDVGNRVDAWQLRQVRVQIDDGPWLQHRYSDREARALRGNALHPFHFSALPVGAHRVRAEFIARELDAPPGTPRVHAQIEQTFETPLADGALELSLLEQGWRGKAAIAVDDGLAGSAPPLRRADFLLASGQPLWAAQQLQDPAVPATAELAARRADAQQALGLSTPAARGAAGIERYNQAATAAEPVALEAIGSAEAGDAGARALRDLANLTLGYHWLREGAGDKAKPVLARVRSPGPYGNAALLGFGWAFLVPEAAEQRPAMFDPALPLWPDGAAQAAELRRSLPFRYLHSVAVGGERLLDLRRALVPWVELLGRDATDPAVQEGMLVVPYALAHLGANAQAQQYTRRAVTQLQQARSELEAAMHHVGEGGLLRVLRQHQAAQQDGWQRELADLRGPAETSYIARLAQNGEVLAAIDAQCELLQLELLLQRQAAALPDAAAALVVQHAALRSRVDNALQQQGAALETLALAELKRGLQHTLAYLAEAHLALARIHDRPLEGENS